MRITQSTVTRRYLSHLEKTYAEKNESEQKINSRVRYNRASQEPLSAAKALRVRKAIANVTDYQSNLNTAKSIYEAADTAVMSISSIIQATVEKVVYGANGTQGPTEEDILADTVETYADEIAGLFNSDIADRRIFGGVNNGTTVFKIEKDASGNKVVSYNGVDINSLQDPKDFPFSEVSYTDIGIGMVIDPVTGRVDPQSALPVTFNGAEISGCGVDEDGYSKNIIQLTLDAAKALRAGNKDEAMNCLDKLKEHQTNLLVSIADIGNKEEFIDFNISRLTNNMESLYEQQNNLEGTDMGVEITNMKVLESVFNATLQMSTSVLSQSIFDYMR